MKAVLFYVIWVTLLTLTSWGITAILGVHLGFWPLVGLSALVGEFISIAKFDFKSLDD